MNNVIEKDNARMARSSSGDVPKGIFVLGMHRSGTSALTRVLNLLGCTLSENLLGAGEGNETGHWEAADVVALNDDMLASAGSSHDDWGPINDDWRVSAIRTQMVQSASVVLADHAKSGPLFAIKDPRMCRIADVWLEAAAEAGIKPLVCLIIRNPAEVAASLEVRDLMATGYSELLWLRHVLDAEHFTRGQRRVICRYDELIDNWQDLVAKIKDGLGISLPRNSPKAHVEISEFLKPSQRHHLIDPSAVVRGPSYSHWLRTTFQIMFDWSNNGENFADYPALDEVRIEIDRAYSTFARLLLSSEVTGAAGAGGQLRRQLADLRDEADHKAEALLHAEQKVEELRSASGQREAELAEQLRTEATQAQALQSEIDRLTIELAAKLSRGEEAEGLRAELAERTAELTEVGSLLAGTQAAVETERQIRTEMEARLLTASNELQDQQLRNAELTGQVATLQSTLIQRQEELAQLLNQLQQSEQARTRAEIECEQEHKLRLELEQRLASVSADIVSLQGLLNDERHAGAQRAESFTRDLAELALSLKEQEDAAHQALEQARESALARVAVERQLADRSNEITELAAKVAQETGRAEAAELETLWLREIRRLEEGFPRWWAIMPRTWRQRRAQRRYLQAALFDAEAYLAQYPDVGEGGMDPIRHYIMHGMAEGRNRLHSP